jgi:hypothetical protein
MPELKQGGARRRPPRSVRVTGRKLSSPAHEARHAAFQLEPLDGVRALVARMGIEHIRALVALMGSEASSPQLLELASPFVGGTLRDHGELHAIGTREINRLRSPENNGYPLRRPLLVVFNREPGRVTAEFREIVDILEMRGAGLDEESALRDLEARFDRLVREKVRVPPHARRVEDLPLVRLVNHLVNWEQFERENPLPRLLWGQVVKQAASGRSRIRWLLGPGGIRKQTTSLPRAYGNAFLAALPPGRWFRAVVKEYPDHVEWIEQPDEAPNPEDPEERRKAWEAIPTSFAGQPGVWPLKEE